MKKPEPVRRQAIVFYDGTCGFCQAGVQFILKHNRKQNLYFAALSSELPQQLTAGARLQEPLPDSMLFYENGMLYVESEAALRMARYLRFPFFLLYSGRFLPLFMRNFIYRIIARNRYRITGCTKACLLPTAQQQKRFLA